MRQLSTYEVDCVNGGAGVSGETIGCAIGGAAGAAAGGGPVGGAVGCIAGAAIANNWDAVVDIIGQAFASLEHVNLTM